MQNPFKNKFIVNFHHADFDGAISGTCAKIALGNDLISKSYSILKVSDAIIKIIDDIDILF